jgi:hypothetical protein
VILVILACNVNMDSLFDLFKYVLCDNLKTGKGNALVDTGSQVLLVAERTLIKGSDIKRHVLKIHGITGNYVQNIRQVNLCIRDTSPPQFLVVHTLPINCKNIIGTRLVRDSGTTFRFQH